MNFFFRLFFLILTAHAGASHYNNGEGIIKVTAGILEQGAGAWGEGLLGGSVGLRGLGAGAWRLQGAGVWGDGARVRCSKKMSCS